MRKYDQSWAQLNAPRMGGCCHQRLSLRPIGTINPAPLAKRLPRAIRLYFTTRYCWALAWQKAA